MRETLAEKKDKIIQKSKFYDMKDNLRLPPLKFGNAQNDIDSMVRINISPSLIENFYNLQGQYTYTNSIGIGK